MICLKKKSIRTIFTIALCEVLVIRTETFFELNIMLFAWSRMNNLVAVISKIIYIKFMYRYFSALIFIFCSLSCSSPRYQREVEGVRIYAENQLEIHEIEKSLSLIKQFELVKDFPYFKSISLIHISEINCSQGELACTFSHSPKAIFLTKSFTSLHPIEKITTLFHEAAHHLYGYEIHTNCRSKEIVNTNCDNSIDSPFGEELKILKFLKKNYYFNDKDLDIYIRYAKHRVNIDYESK